MGHEIPGSNLLHFDDSASKFTSARAFRPFRQMLTASSRKKRSTGSYKAIQTDESPNVLSDGTLIWMVAKAKSFLDFDEEYLHSNIRAARIARDQGSLPGYGGDGFHPPLNSLPQLESQLQSPWYNGPVSDVYSGRYMLWLLLGRHIRQVLGYMPDEEEFKNGVNASFIKSGRALQSLIQKIRLRFVKRGKQSGGVMTNEYIHRSVLDRGTAHDALRNVSWEGAHSASEDLSKVEIEEYSDFELRFWGDEKQFA